MRSRRTKTAHARRAARTSKSAGRNGLTARSTSTLRGSSSSTRLGRARTWPARTAGHRRAGGCCQRPSRALNDNFRHWLAPVWIDGADRSRPPNQRPLVPNLYRPSSCPGAVARRLCCDPQSRQPQKYGRAQSDRGRRSDAALPAAIHPRLQSNREGHPETQGAAKQSRRAPRRRLVE